MSFINPFFLVAVTAGLLPVLYHLVRRMRAKKVQFSSLMFLTATPKELVRKRRLKDVLLMAVRALMFILLAIAFARPFVPDQALPFLGQAENQSVVLLLDRSYSMQYGDWFEQVRTEALDRLDNAGPNDEFAVIAFADEAQQLTALDPDLSIHRNVIENTLEVSNRPTDFYKPLRMAEEVLKDARFEDRVIVLISDFQQNGWSGAFDNWKLDPDIAMLPVKIASEVGPNSTVASFGLVQKRIGDDVAVQYDARFQSGTETNPAPVQATLTVDRAPVHQQAIQPIPSRPFTFQHMADRSGYLQGDIALPEDDLPIDNRYYFTYRVSDRPALLCVDEGPRRSTRDAFFLENAFNLGDQSLYAFSAGNRGLLTRASLRNQSVVFLTNVNALSNNEVDQLRQFVEEGGSLVVSFGNEVDTEQFSRHLQSWGVGRIEEAVSARQVQSYDAIIGEVDLRHPIFSVFAAAGSGAIFRPKFRRYLRVTPDQQVNVLGSYDTGDPFLLERTLGQGKILVYTSTFNTSWTDFPVNELYLPFVYQLVKYAVNDANQDAMFTVGDVVPLEGRIGDEWDVSAPGDRMYRVEVDSFGTGFFRETEVPGHYMAIRGQQRYYFSVNVDPVESDLQTRDQEEAYATIVPPTEQVAGDPQQAAAALDVVNEEKRQKFWRYIILFIIGLFVLETVLANRPVRRKT